VLKNVFGNCSRRAFNEIRTYSLSDNKVNFISTNLVLAEGRKLVAKSITESAQIGVL
jgi:hypothetical protein